MGKILFLIIPLVIFGLLISPDAKAGTGDNVSGYAWSENIGWISFNCTNQDTCGTADYGVNIDSSGNFSGYAWSENIGWIDFAPASPYPSAPDYSAKVNEVGEVSGWTRALSFGDGWEGWIKMRDTDYGVSIAGTGEFQGFAWSDMVVGWISFKGDVYGVITTFSFNQPPNKPECPEGESWNHCSIQALSVPALHWTYSDPDGDPQAAYEIRIDDDSDFSVQDPEEFTDSGGASTAYAPIPSEWSAWMNWSTDYWWIVRVQDSPGNWSEWSDANNLRTPNHAYPWPDFTWSPEEPSQGEVVEFNPDLSETYGGAIVSSRFWTITEGEGQYIDDTSNVSQYPHIIFSTPTNKVKLNVTDSDGYWCEKEKAITAEFPFPEFREVAPIIWLKKIMAAIVNFFNGFLKF